MFSVEAPSTIGWVFSGVVLVGLGLYLGLGMALGGRRKGLAAHPHFTRFQQLGQMCHDGVAFARSRGRANASAALAERLHNGSSRRGEDGGRGEGGGTRAASNGKKQKKDTKKQKKDRKSKKGDGQASLALEDAAPAAPEVVVAPAREWAPTRTGHLAVGARETGVKVQMT